MIGVVDYGIGNVRAFLNIYKRLNIPAFAAATPEDMHRADRLILPGVGAFDWAMRRLDESGLRLALEEAVLEHGKPVLGVCVGMHMLADSSEEGESAGLGWIAGNVRRFRHDNPCLPLPHMGWNDVRPRVAEGLMAGLEEGRFYFLHSYYFEPQHAAHALATTDYGGTFVCAVQSDNCFGVQFHPEKSHAHGIRLLRNFAEM